MIEAATREAKAGGDVLRLEIRQLFENLLRRKPIGHQIEYINDANTHAADARTPPALKRVNSDSVGNISDGLSL